MTVQHIVNRKDPCNYCSASIDWTEKEASPAVILAGSQRAVASSFTTLEKLQLFNNFFVGRRDVYARGLQSKKSSRICYTPAWANADNSNLCQRGRIYCLDCSNRVFAKLDQKPQNASARPRRKGQTTLSFDSWRCLLAPGGGFQFRKYAYQSLEKLHISI